MHEVGYTCSCKIHHHIIIIQKISFLRRLFLLVNYCCVCQILVVCVYVFVYGSILCYFQYDINGDGVLEFLLSTSDAEIIFVQTDNTLLHGETIKVSLVLPS